MPFIRSWRIAVALLAYGCYLFGVKAMVLYYFVPLFIMASWILVVTFLHHHEAELDLPWFGDAYVVGLS